VNKPKSERVDEILKRVKSAPPAHDRQSAHMLVKDILEDVENTLTTLPSNHMDRMKFFSLGVCIWVDENKNPTHVILNNYKAILYDNGSIVIERIKPYEVVLDKRNP
jgi:hypothetical protein